MNLYIASCTENGGIYHYNRQEDGTLVFVEKTELDRPMYMIIDNHKMYIVLLAPFENGESGVIIYEMDENGRLCNPSEIMCTKGVEACHIAVHDGVIYCANYTSGSVIMLPDLQNPEQRKPESQKQYLQKEVLVQHSGHGLHPVRQESPHTHFVGMTPDGKYLCVTDLGLDTIFLYHPDLTLQAAVKVPDGHGVRHLAFSEDGKYLFAANELGSTVAAYAYDDGTLSFVDLCSTLPAAFEGESTIAAIRIRDSQIYVSNRGHDSIAVLQFANEKLRLLACYDCGGSSPRDFMFAGEDIICTNQFGNCVTILDGANGFTIRETIPMEAPLCVCIQ